MSLYEKDAIIDRAKEGRKEGRKIDYSSSNPCPEQRPNSFADMHTY